MTSTMTLNPSSARDVLYEFALAKDRPDADLLEEFIRRYPQHAAELTDFAVSVALELYAESAEHSFEPVVLPRSGVSPVVSRAMSRFHNRLFEVKCRATENLRARAELPHNPFSALDKAAIRKLARGLNASNLFVMKLRDCEVRDDTITEGFRRRVSEELQVPINVLAAHFAAEATVHTASRHKSDEKPSAQPKQTFEEAVRSSGLTEEQQRYLLSL